MGKQSKGETYWRRINERYEESGLSLVKFCRQEQIALSTLQLWRKRLRSGDIVPARFVEVEVPSPTTQANAEIHGELIVELPYGVRLRFRGLTR